MNKNELLIIENIIKEHEKNIIGLSTKICIVDIMKDFDIYAELSEETKAKLLDFIYSYWMHSELTENSLFDIVYLVSEKIGKSINKIDFRTFSRFIDDLI